MSKSTDVRTPGYEKLAKKWKIPVSKMVSLVIQGSKVETEHTKDKEKAKEIARDHLGERPDYYRKLSKMEKTQLDEISKEKLYKYLTKISKQPSSNREADYYYKNERFGALAIAKLDHKGPKEWKARVMAKEENLVPTNEQFGMSFRKKKVTVQSGRAPQRPMNARNISDEDKSSKSPNADLIKRVMAPILPKSVPVKEDNQLDENLGKDMKKYKFWHGDPRGMKDRLKKAGTDFTKKIAASDDKLGGAAELQRRIARKMEEESETLDETNKQNKKKKLDWEKGYGRLKMKSHFDPRRMLAAHNRKKVEGQKAMQKEENQIAEALNAMLEKNYVIMEEKIQSVLQEKIVEAFDERKKIIAANYFGQ